MVMKGEKRKEWDKNSGWGLTNGVKIVGKGMFVLNEVLKEEWQMQRSWKENVCWERKGRMKISFEEKEKNKRRREMNNGTFEK